MIRLMYVSTASAHLTNEEVERLVSKAETDNRKNGITGLLAFNGINFAQVIEGETEDIDYLIQKLRNDQRHSGLIVVSRRLVSNRAFPDWGMKLSEGLDFQEILTSLQV